MKPIILRELKRMSGEKDLEKLLKNMSPTLNEGEYVFITLPGYYGEYTYLEPIGSFKEKEGLTLIIPIEKAIENNIEAKDIFKVITLNAHSSLNAVGLTAAVASKLSLNGISANVIAAYYHDHIFVQTQYAEKALSLLMELIE